MNGVISFLGNIGAWIVKNFAMLVGIVESILKVVASIVSLTPTKKDDVIYEMVNQFFSKIKAPLYKLSELLAGKA